MLTLIAASLLAAPPVAYDPLAVGSAPVQSIDETWTDGSRNRPVPVRLFFPANRQAAPVVLFSHGLGGSRANNGFLGEHLARRGYLAVFMQHPGSDESVWKGVPMRERMQSMQSAASGENLRLRVGDVKFVIDELARRNQANGNLRSRVNLNAIGVSGHSFGAVTSQAVGGQRYAAIGQQWTDSRIRAAVMYSPSPAKVGQPSRDFGSVQIPWMLMTGTEDNSTIGRITPEDRLKVYPALPNGDKYEVVMFGAQHSAFSERSLPGERNARNPNHHRIMLGLTTAFWDTYLAGDGAAKAWLKGDGPRTLLEPKDTWKLK